MIVIHIDICFNKFQSFKTKTFFLGTFTYRSLESTVEFPYQTTFFYVTNKLALFVSTVFSRVLTLTSYLLMYSFNFSNKVQSTFIRFLLHNLDFFKKRVSLLLSNYFIDIVAKNMKKSNYSTCISICLLKKQRFCIGRWAFFRSLFFLMAFHQFLDIVIGLLLFN
jgi:hypothetical protein